jgi:hypothetical protein
MRSKYRFSLLLSMEVKIKRTESRSQEPESRRKEKGKRGNMKPDAKTQ